MVTADGKEIMGKTPFCIVAEFVELARERETILYLPDATRVS
jgi:hypothetical protein